MADRASRGGCLFSGLSEGVEDSAFHPPHLIVPGRPVTVEERKALKPSSRRGARGKNWDLALLYLSALVSATLEAGGGQRTTRNAERPKATEHPLGPWCSGGKRSLLQHHHQRLREGSTLGAGALDHFDLLVRLGSARCMGGDGGLCQLGKSWFLGKRMQR